ncbi:MAG: hypothetical protein WCO56_06430 [Verrucomicrobiota bacterium]
MNDKMKTKATPNPMTTATDLAALPEPARLQLADGWLAGLSHAELQENLRRDFDCELAPEAFARLFEECVLPRLLDRRARTAHTAKLLAAQPLPDGFDAALFDQLKQRLLELALNPVLKPADILALMTLWLKYRDQELDRQKLEREEPGSPKGEAGIRPETMAYIEEKLKLM